MCCIFKSRLSLAGKSSIGYKKYKNNRHFWDKEVEHLIKDRRQANRLYRIWSKHPDCSPDLLQVLWDDYLEKKKNVALKVKEKNVHQKIKNITEVAAKASSNPRAYWRLLKKLNKSNDYPLRIRDPLDTNVIIDDPKQIRDALTKYWSSLGNCKKEENSQIKDNILYNQTHDANSFHNVIFDRETIQHALSKLKNNKATGVDNIPAEFLKHGGHTLENILVQLMSKIKLLEVIPNEWYEGIVKPIFKAGNRELLSNYRGITISSVVYKLLVSIIERQAMAHIEENNLLSDFQGAFRKGRRVEDHVFTIKGICSLRKCKKLKTFLGFLDISKAFDTLDRQRLFQHIYNKGIQGKAFNLIKALYHKVDNRVIFGSFESDIFTVDSGVKQGCVLSPALFNLVMNDLESMLDICQGIEIDNVKMTGLFYADDIILMGNSKEDLLHMLSVADKFSQKWGMSFNDTKSKVMTIGKKLSPQSTWKLGDKLLKETKSYKYLGVFINKFLTDTYHINTHLKDKANKLDSYIRYTLSNNLDVKRITLGNTLWEKAVLPALAHGAGVWFCDTNTARVSLTKIQYKCAKGVLKLYSMPARLALFSDLGWMNILDHLDILRINYFNHLGCMDNSRIAKIVFNKLFDNFTCGKSEHFKYMTNMKNIFTNAGVDHLFNANGPVNVNIIKNIMHESHKIQFYNDINNFSSLETFKCVTSQPISHIRKPKDYLAALNFKAAQLKFKLRAGILGLGCDLARQHRGDGMCKNCNIYESIKHFIFKCPMYNNERSILYDCIKCNVDDDVFNLFISNWDLGMVLLLGDHDDVFNKFFSTFLVTAWEIHQSM